jgi:hypothetical protein
MEYLCHTWPRICSTCRTHFPVLSLFMTYHRFVTRLTRRVWLAEQELLTLPEHLSLPLIFSEVRVTKFLVLCVCFVDRYLSYCPFLLVFMLSVLLRYMDSDYTLHTFFAASHIWNINLLHRISFSLASRLRNVWRYKKGVIRSRRNEVVNKMVRRKQNIMTKHYTEN